MVGVLHGVRHVNVYERVSVDESARVAARLAQWFLSLSFQLPCLFSIVSLLFGCFLLLVFFLEVIKRFVCPFVICLLSCLMKHLIIFLFTHFGSLLYRVTFCFILLWFGLQHRRGPFMRILCLFCCLFFVSRCHLLFYFLSLRCFLHRFFWLIDLHHGHLFHRIIRLLIKLCFLII